jgi:predicted P-loop ATPase
MLYKAITELSVPSDKDFSSTGLTPNDLIEELLAKHCPGLRRNSITGLFELNSEPLLEEDINSLLVQFEKEAKKTISEARFFRILKSNFIPSQNPIMEFFESLNSSQPEGRIGDLASCIETDTGMQDSNFFPQYVEHFLRKWLVGCVSQALGTSVNDLMLVLAGGQNTGKTTYFRLLLPDPLRRFFAEVENMDDKKDADIAMLMTENLILLDDEMRERNRSDLNAFKSLLSKDFFTVRKPYDKRQGKYKRIASFCGTTNELEILKDPTGNRRIVPIRVISIDHEKYNGINKTELWSEVYTLYKRGFKHHLTAKDIDLLKECTPEFQVEDQVAGILRIYFDAPSEDLDKDFYLTSTEVLELLNRHTRSKIYFTPNTIGQRLKLLGYKQIRSDAKGSRAYNIQLKEKYRNV